MKKLIRITTVPVSLKVLLKGQLKYMSDFFEVKAISSPGKELYEVSENENIEVIPLNLTRKISPLQDFISLVKLYFIFKKEKPVIVHTHTPKAGLLGMIAAYFAGVKIRMHTVAGLPLTVATGFKKKLLVFTEKITYKFATNVYPNSEKLKEYILKNNFCENNKLKVIGNGSTNGIDTEYFKPKKEIFDKAAKIKKQFNIPDNVFVFLFVGRIVKDKGINELVRAFKELNLENSRLLLTGNFENDLNPLDKDISEEIKNNKNIIATGYAKDVRPFFALADVFVFPSYREGFPNVVMQAGAMEIPAVVSDINGCNEIITNNENGLIVKPKNTDELITAMKRMYRDKELLKYLKSNCRNNIVADYSQKYVWKQLLNEYNSLLNYVPKNN